MSFLTLYLISVVTMLFFYWLDQKNSKYRDMTYSDFTLCVIMTFFPVVNTTFALFSCYYSVSRMEFWQKKPFKKE